jgi:hypothetical protein
MLLTQIAVAVLRQRREALQVLQKMLQKERAQYSCNSEESVKEGQTKTQIGSKKIRRSD